MIAFAVVARLLLGRTSATLALAAAVAAWLVACAAIYGIMRAVVHLLGESSYCQRSLPRKARSSSAPYGAHR